MKPRQNRNFVGKAGPMIATLFVIGWTVAMPAQADSLSQMLQDVYDNNPDIRAEEAGLESRRAVTDKARSAMFPSLSASASHKLADENTKSGASRRTRTTQYGLTASHRLFNGFQDRNQILKARYQERSGHYDVRHRETLVLLDAVRAYMDVYAARKMMGLRRQHVANLQKQRRATKARMRAGELTRTDLSRTDALLSRARASLAGAQADLGGASARFEALAGYKPRSILYPQMPSRYVPKTVEDAQHKALRLHPQLRSARAKSKALKHQVKASKGSFLPSVDLSAGYTRSSTSRTSTTPDLEKSLSLRLSLPIFDGGGRKADVRKATADYSQARYQANSLAATVRAQAKERYLKYKAAKTIVTQAKIEVKAARDTLRGIKIEEKAGQRSFLDVLDAEVALLDAREVEVYAQADSVIALYSYLSYSGQLTVAGSRLAQANAKHDPYIQGDDEATSAIPRSSVDRAKAAAKRQNRRTPTKGRTVKDPWSGLR
jgi:outer membrane protein